MHIESDILHCLARANIAFDPARIQWESRKGRTVATLDNDRVAWFPEHSEGRADIEKDRRILRLIEKYCTYRAPRVLYEDATGWDVRAIVPGFAAPDFLDLVRTDPHAAQLMGAALGRILAEQHSRIPVSELEHWLTRTPPWPLPSALEKLPKVVDDASLLMRIDSALEHWKAMHVSDPVLIHCDLGPWNIAVSPVTGEVHGVFDYGDAAFGDRHQDFKYMQFQRPSEQTLLEAAIQSYEAESRVTLDRERIRFFNAIEAIAFLGFRHGHPPHESWCGRTLAEDIEWTNAALADAGF